MTDSRGLNLGINRGACLFLPSSVLQVNVFKFQYLITALSSVVLEFKIVFIYI